MLSDVEICTSLRRVRCVLIKFTNYSQSFSQNQFYIRMTFREGKVKKVAKGIKRVEKKGTE